MDTRDRFRIFNERGGKFRVAVTNVCNLSCFFCHNEGMSNPRRPGDPVRMGRALSSDDLVRLMNAFAALGGRQINVTGGEPLALPNIVPMLEAIEKRSTKVILNSNVLLAERLLAHPKVENLDSIFASLHTTDDEVFQKNLGGPTNGARRVMDNIVALSRHGYDVQINYSLSDYNKDGFDEVLAFALEHGIALKAIALVRPNDEDGFYNGAWISTAFVQSRLERAGATFVSESEGFGGHVTTYKARRSRLAVKNVARGRLETDFCGGCPHRALCGEGIYAIRIGPDGLWKPCLLRHESFWSVDPSAPFEPQILEAVGRLVGDWKNARFAAGAPV